MNRFSPLRLFPWVTLFLGTAGFALQSWLFSCVDSKGLLPRDHIAAPLCFILLALSLGSCLWGLLRMDSAPACDRTACAAKGVEIGGIVGGLVMVFSVLLPVGADLFSRLAALFGLVIGICLLIGAFCRLKGKPVPPATHYACMAFLVLRIMLSCRSWSGETQVQSFVFALFAALFFLLTLYHRAQLAILGAGNKHFFLFSQAALFCSCVNLSGPDFLFSLGVVIWLAAETCGLPASSQGECV